MALGWLLLILMLVDAILIFLNYRRQFNRISLLNFTNSRYVEPGDFIDEQAYTEVRNNPVIELDEETSPPASPTSQSIHAPPRRTRDPITTHGVRATAWD